MGFRVEITSLLDWPGLAQGRWPGATPLPADVEVDGTVEAALAEEQSPASGTQECPRGSRDTESLGLQEKGKRKELTPGVEVSGGFRGQPGRALGQGRAGAAGSARRT